MFKRQGKYFFTSDEHYGHRNIILYCNRPFKNVKEMDEEIIARHNSVVTNDDTVIHAGDFTLIRKYNDAAVYFSRLNGNHIFLRGSHDYWLPKKQATRWEKLLQSHYFVVDHYAMRTWARSHFNSFQLYGHSHGKLEPVGKQWDIGVDNNDFYPVSEDQIIQIMKDRPDNPNYIKGK